MLIYWFTRPAKPFDSYYQYDTTTKRFCRVRLELNRTRGSGDAKAMYERRWAVGFSPNKNLDDKVKSHWTVDDKGTLSYDNQPLRNRPTTGDWVYDTGIPSSPGVPGSYIHAGNQVPAGRPNLPPGIEPKHLALIANEAMLKMTGIKLSSGEVSPEALAADIKGKVCEILKVDNFGAISDSMITTKLNSQAEALYGEAVSESRAGLASGLHDAQTAAKSANELITKQLGDGMVPDETIQKAFGSLESALTRAGTASGSADIQRALAEIGKARQAVKEAVAATATAENQDAAKKLSLATESLDLAGRNAVRWQTAETEYKPLIEAKDANSYMDALSAEKEII